MCFVASAFRLQAITLSAANSPIIGLENNLKFLAPLRMTEKIAVTTIQSCNAGNVSP
jgi:hypothetical protein